MENARVIQQGEDGNYRPICIVCGYTFAYTPEEQKRVAGEARELMNKMNEIQ